MSYAVSTGYKIIGLCDLEELRADVLSQCKRLGILGTIIIGYEGINMTVSGKDEAVRELYSFFNAYRQSDGQKSAKTTGKNIEKNIRKFEDTCRGASIADSDINGNYSKNNVSQSCNLNGVEQAACLAQIPMRMTFCDYSPFKKLKVKIRGEIVTYRNQQTAYLAAEEVGQYCNTEEWDALLQSDRCIAIDTRNHYEYVLGTFRNAVNPQTNHFSEFSSWMEDLVDGKVRISSNKFYNNKEEERFYDLLHSKDCQLALFCTSGIRCEKATAHLKKIVEKKQKSNSVYHLKGGVMQYLLDKIETSKVEDRPEGAKGPTTVNLWDGALFVFDDRMALQRDTLAPVCQQR